MGGLQSPIQLHTSVSSDTNGRMNQLQTAHDIAVEFLSTPQCLKCCSQLLLHTYGQQLCRQA